MSENERRRTYRYDRILIDTNRVLTPVFDDAVIYITGAQVEMLRNITQYLNRLSTYVTEHQSGYYLAPTPEDYDDILAIVADLEETLMGNPNTIWGYKDRLKEDLYEDAPDAGTNYLDTTPVPANEVHVVTDTLVYKEGAGVASIILRSQIDGTVFYLMRETSPISNVAYNWQGSHVLKEGDYLRAIFYSTLVDDVIQFKSRGYIMDVPT